MMQSFDLEIVKNSPIQSGKISDIFFQFILNEACIKIVEKSLFLRLF